MRTARRILSGILLVAAIVAVTGLVMERNRRMSLFLQARDRIEAGWSPAVALLHLEGAIDWAPEDQGLARRLCREVRPDRDPILPLALHRAGPWGLLVTGSSRSLLERTMDGWRTVP